MAVQPGIPFLPWGQGCASRQHQPGATRPGQMQGEFGGDAAEAARDHIDAPVAQGDARGIGKGQTHAVKELLPAVPPPVGHGGTEYVRRLRRVGMGNARHVPQDAVHDSRKRLSGARCLHIDAHGLHVQEFTGDDAAGSENEGLFR